MRFKSYRLYISYTSNNILILFILAMREIDSSIYSVEHRVHKNLTIAAVSHTTASAPLYWWIVFYITSRLHICYVMKHREISIAFICMTVEMPSCVNTRPWLFCTAFPVTFNNSWSSRKSCNMLNLALPHQQLVLRSD